MSSDICFLISIFYEFNNTLIKCAVKFDRNLLPVDCDKYPMEHRHAIHDMLPLHVKSCGPIVDIEQIFEVTEYNQGGSCE